MAGLTSPDVNNISVGTGYIEFKPDGDLVYYHVGNVPSLSFSMKSKTLDHYSPVNGMRVKDYTWTIEQEAEVEMLMEEITARNLQMLVLGDIETTGGVTTVKIAARAARTGALKYTATNEIGPRWCIDLFAVNFNSDGSYDPISSGSDFNTIKVTGSALAVNGEFGVFTLL